jgi:hypothetical protein
MRRNCLQLILIASHALNDAGERLRAALPQQLDIVDLVNVVL